MKRDNRIVETGDRLAPAVPGQRKTRSVTSFLAILATELERGEARVLAKGLGRHLISGDAVVKALP